MTGLLTQLSTAPPRSFADTVAPETPDRAAPTRLRRRRNLLAWAGLVASLLAIALAVTSAGPELVRGLAGVAFAAIGPGAAVLSHRPARDPVVSWALTVLISVGTVTAVATAMIWFGWWQPGPVTAGLAAVTAGSSLLALARARRGDAEAVAERTAGPRRRYRGHALILVAAVGLWLAAVALTDPTRVGPFGLLATVHPAYLLGLLAVVAGFVAELRRRDSNGWLLGTYVVLLIALVHATTPLLLDVPQYAWTYKHLGVVELLQQQGQLVNPGDLYQQWPALFAGVAWLADLTGVPAMALADWSAVGFNLAGALVLLAIARSLTTDRRVPFLTVFLFLSLNWVEEDYLSPQALAFLLSLGVLLVVVRWLRAVPGRHGRGRGSRLRRRFVALPPAPAVNRTTRTVAAVGMLGLFAVLTAAHQLSPYLLVGQVTLLVLLGVVRPRWIVPAMAAIAIGYFLPRFGVVDGSFNLFDGIDILGNAGGNADSWGSFGQAFSAAVVRVLALTVWGLAALAVWRERRHLGRVLLPAILAFSPFLLLAGQSYGGEAIYRVFLFSAPWCAYLIADQIRRISWPANGGRRMLLLLAATLILLAAVLGTVQGRHGQLMVDRQTGAEVAAAEHLYANAEPGATVALAGSNFPSRLAGNYGDFNRSLPVGEPELVVGGDMAGAQLNRAYLPLIEQYLGTFESDTAYLVVSDGMRRQADYFGQLPDGSLDVLENTLAGGEHWAEFYRNDEVVIYRFDAPASQ